jgi:hypothetical protein
VCVRAGRASSVSRFATGWTVRGSNSGGGEVHCNRPDRCWGQPILLLKRHRISLSGVKQPGCGLDQPSPSSSEVQERVKLFLYFPSVLLWPVIGQTFIYFTLMCIVQYVSYHMSNHRIPKNQGSKKLHGIFEPHKNSRRHRGCIWYAPYLRTHKY